MARECGARQPREPWGTGWYLCTKHVNEKGQHRGRHSYEEGVAAGYAVKGERFQDWTCPKCGGDASTHSLADAIEHIYEGAELKDGGKLGRGVAEDIANRVIDKLKG